MIFNKIVLTNIFSYSGECVFDLSGRTDEKNIVLISGGNGFGKTSFLNAIKLLFTGVTNDLRKGVQRQRMPSVKSYVLGIGDDWWGIVNRHANKKNTNCSVQIIWTENDFKVNAKREWKIVNNNIESMSITVRFDSKLLEGEDAQCYLAERLPEVYVPFFFFDGERIQELAESNVNQTMEYIERLLNISHINNLRSALSDSITRWEKEGALDQAAETKLEHYRNKLTLLDKKSNEKKQLEDDLQYEIERLDEDLEENQRKIESIHQFISQNNEGSIKHTIEERIKEKEELRMRTVEMIPENLPMLANESLVNRINSELIELLSSSNSSDELINQLIKYLPADVFEKPPFSEDRISDEQQSFYKKKLIKKLESYSSIEEESSDNENITFSLNKFDAKKLQNSIQPYLNNNLLRIDRSRILSDISINLDSLKKLNADLLNTASLSYDEKVFYTSVNKDIKKIHERKNEKNRDLGKVQNEKKRIENEKLEASKSITVQKNNLSITRSARLRMNRAKEIQKLFSAYKDQMKKERKEDLENYINKYFKKLMSSNNLISSIKLDDEFGLHYHDKNGETIGMGNLSAGMKQLAATALLWALKTCSEKPIPIIVDTPMARIDKQNQINLLKHYYPHVSEQVIILPTDSEMDKEKYNLLKPYIYQEYILKNTAGDKTQPIRKPMYPEVSRGDM